MKSYFKIGQIDSKVNYEEDSCFERGNFSLKDLLKRVLEVLFVTITAIFTGEPIV